MSNQNVRVDLELGVRSEKARQALEEFHRSAAETFEGMHPQARSANMDELERKTRTVAEVYQRILGDSGSFLKQRREINRELDIENSRLQQMRRHLEWMKGHHDPAIRQGASAYERELHEQHGKLTAMRHVRNIGEAQEASGSTGGASGGWLSGIPMGRGAGAAIVDKAVTSVLAFMTANPLTAAVGIGMFATKWLSDTASRASQFSEDIDLSFTNSARRTGMGTNLRGVFQKQKGTADPDFERLGFTGDQLASMVDAYGMPGSSAAVRQSILAQGKFARANGFGEHPELIASIGRRATELGVGEVGVDQKDFWTKMSAAVNEGVTRGVDKTATMRALVGLTERVASHTGIASREQLTGIAAAQMAFAGAEGGSRFFKGEDGAKRLAQFTEGFTNPKDIASQRFVMNLISKRFGGVPGADDLQEMGLLNNPHAVDAYNRMNTQQKQQFVMSNMSANPRLMGSVMGGAGRAAGTGIGSESVLIEMLTGVGPAMQPNLRVALAEAAKKAGLDQKSIRGMSTLDLGGAIYDKSPDVYRDAIMKARSEQDPELTKVEQMRFFDRQSMEGFSASASNASQSLRIWTKDIERHVAALGAMVTGGGVGEMIERKRSAPPDRIPDLPPPPGDGTARGRKMSYSGGSSDPIRVEVSGSIDVSGEAVESGGMKLSAHHLAPLFEKAISERVGLSVATGSSRHSINQGIA